MQAPQHRRSVQAVLILAITILILVFMPSRADAQSPEAPANPCPYYSIQDIFNDPTSDWDRDRVPNAVELDHGENPCVPVSANFCNQQPSLCTFTYRPVSATCSVGTYWNWAEVNYDPNSGWDGDGVSNVKEANNGANPCAHPCPTPTPIDLALSPNRDWDRDGIRNGIEVFNGTNPCIKNRGLNYVITPATGTGYSCPFGYPYYNAATRLCYRTPQPVPQPAPVVLPATPPAGYTCPAGFPYYNAVTRLCYNFSQPVVRPAAVIAPATPPPGYTCPAGFPYYSARTRLCHTRPF